MPCFPGQSDSQTDRRVAPEADANRAKQIASNVGWIQDTAWTPDDRIVFSSSAGGNAEVWVMNADGSNPKQLTRWRIAAEQILAFDGSRDGRSLALVRGVEPSEVVLIRNAALK